MKIGHLILLLLFTIVFHRSESQIVLFAKKIKPEAGVENYYVYKPAKGLLVPDSIKIVAIYLQNNDIHIKTVSVRKVGNNYTFPFKFPDSTSMLILSITKPKSLNKFDNSVETANIVDNNNGIGFIIPLYTKEYKRFDFEKIDKATLLYHFAPHFIKLNETPKTQLINWYEETYQKYPELKNTNACDYHYYLDLLYKEKGDGVRPQLLKYAKKMEDMKQDEKKWIWAAKAYNILGMQQEQSKVEKDIVTAYPAGPTAKENFWQKFYLSVKLGTSSILTTMNSYISQFNDTSSSSKDNFYIQIVSLNLNKKSWDSLAFYESLVSNKIYLSNIYNNFALRLCTEKLDTSRSHLAIAKMLSKKSLNYSEYQIANPLAGGDSNDYLQGLYNRFADTYAQILYKLGEYDSAFYYQDAIYKQPDQLGSDGMERYALYSEKVKGIDYAKQLIEEQLLRGVSTPSMLKQLQSIYKKMGIDDDKFNAIKEKYSVLALKKNMIEIKTKFGTTKAKNFTLENILGLSVSLSALKGKVVVLDFWATWCAPCIAAFPMMQETVNKYKNDKGVTFLFVDILEHTTAKRMQENAAKLMKVGNYSFNVLLDVKDELVTNYKIESIPTIFIIDKKGNMVFMGNATDNISSLIEAAKKL